MPASRLAPQLMPLSPYPYPIINNRPANTLNCCVLTATRGGEG
jgi:hypothetical protein